MAAPSLSLTPYDPSGESLSWRYTTNGQVRSYKWTLTDSSPGTPIYEIVTGEEATHGDSYFFVSCIVPSGWSASGVNATFVMEHDFVVINDLGKWYTATADLIGASLVLLTGNAPAAFRVSLVLDEYDVDFGPVYIPATSGLSTASAASNVRRIPAGVMAYTAQMDASTRYVKPRIVLTIGDLALAVGTTIEFRFDNLRLMGGRAGASLNGVTPNQVLYAPDDPNYVAPVDPYSQMSLVAPSIGTRIERPCYIEQIRYDIAPGNDKWMVSLGLSDAITGSYWALDKSKLDVDTRLSI